MRKILIISTLGIITIIIFSYVVISEKEQVGMVNEDPQKVVKINPYFDESFLFDVYLPLDAIDLEGNKIISKASTGYLELNSDNASLYEELKPHNNDKSVVIIPMFTAMAYSENGFYDYYKGICDESCLTVKLKKDLGLTHNSSNFGAQVLRLLGYEWMTDMKVNNNPESLLDYDRIILLHNEYVTRTMFDAITSHPMVIYLYPNSLYAEIAVNNEDESITLIRGHNFPQLEITNGFDWEYDNTHPYEYDTSCNDWNFYEINNGYMLNCYPENAVFQSVELLEEIRDLGVS